jgi:predicted nucleotidyltransferase
MTSQIDSTTKNNRVKALEQVVEALAEHYQPRQMFLFGSEAGGTAREDSDFDLLLVVEKAEGSILDRMIEAQRVIEFSPVRSDVFIYTVEEFNRWKGEFSSVPEVALNTGKELKVG